MTHRRRSTVELVLAVLAAAGAVWCWFAARSVVDVAPILAAEPRTTAIAYDPPMLVLMLLLATGAGVLAVLGISRRHRPASAK